MTMIPDLLLVFVLPITSFKFPSTFYYRPRSEGDNVLGSVRPSVRLSVRLSVRPSVRLRPLKYETKMKRKEEESLSVRDICLCVDYLARMRSIGF